MDQPGSLRCTTPSWPLLVAFAVAAAAAALAGCSVSTTPAPQPTCAPPAPVPLQIADLVYPIPGATRVPPGIGLLVFFGFGDLAPGTSIRLSDAAGMVPVGSVTAAPSPLPTPNATPSGQNSQQFAAVPIPRLAPATTYTVALRYLAYADNPPVCQATYTKKLGSFRTGPAHP
jgi:hypothetical protein